MSRLIIFIFFSALMIGCSEVNTSQPDKVFYHWTGTNPPKDLELINGQYWQSAHFTREYIMYLQIKPTEKWLNDFIKQNHLIIDKTAWTKASDTPEWFIPNDSAIRYKSENSFDQGSRYFWDKSTGEFYIYEIQL